MVLKPYQEKLTRLAEQGLTRELREIQGPQGRTLRHGGKEYLNFSSNNYLGLAEDVRLREAFIDGLNRYGVGAGAARLVNGSMSPFHQLERALAEFKNTQAALLFNSGYQANVGALSCLAESGDVIFSDALNHASMIDGIRLSKAEKVVYAHNDLSDLREKLETWRSRHDAKGKILIATESVFSMDGDLCRLKELLDLAQETGALIYLDEAHATGVFGETGAGLAEGHRRHPAYETHLIQMGTLGKALGCFGAYVAGPQVIVDYLLHCARTFIYTTALPPALASAALASLEIIQQEPERRDRLRQRMEQLKQETAEKLPEFGVQIQSPIVPIVVGEAARAVALSDYLQGQGYWVSAIRPPTVAPGTSRLRITLMATHTEEDIRGLVAALKQGVHS
jgi:8-amino-7-oxononanoate synthase